MTLDLSRAVGADGTVTGIDPSDAMLASARQRCAGRGNVTLLEGSADALPLPDAGLDGAVSLQVFEYVADIPAALAELARVLRPGGRLVIGDMHFGTIAWHSADPDRMARMLASWDRHVVDRALPATLPASMRAAGFDVLDVLPFNSCDVVLRPDGLAAMMLILVRNYAVANGHVPEEEARAWEAEQRALARDGRFFFSLTHFVTVARRC
jgi:SAM-dependent methyltransferase